MYNSFKDTIAEAYQQVELFNEIAGSTENVTVGKLDSQLSYIYEELVETIDALEAQDDKEFLDGIADVFVTVAGLIQIAEKAGYNVSEAIKRVNVNNLSKYPPYYLKEDIDERGNVIKRDYQVDTSIQPENTVADLNTRFSVVAFKDAATGKVKKPLNFVPVDLSGTYPDFLKKGV